MIDDFKKTIASISDKSHLGEDVAKKFEEKLNSNTGLTRDENEKSHFCSFFLPIHLSTQSIFLGHHIKGNDWMPPGGHIEKREFYSAGWFNFAKLPTIKRPEYQTAIQKLPIVFNFSGYTLAI